MQRFSPKEGHPCLEEGLILLGESKYTLHGDMSHLLQLVTWKRFESNWTNRRRLLNFSSVSPSAACWRALLSAFKKRPLDGRRKSLLFLTCFFKFNSNLQGSYWVAGIEKPLVIELHIARTFGGLGWIALPSLKCTFSPYLASCRFDRFFLSSERRLHFPGWWHITGSPGLIIVH